MKPIYLARDGPSAELLRCLLEAAGIRAMVEGAALSSVVGGIPLTAYPRILVQDEDVPRAVELIRASGIERQPQNCPHCGYNLTGLSEPRCPECGLPFAMDERWELWKCQTCGESIEGQFTSCWKCGSERTVAKGD